MSADLVCLYFPRYLELWREMRNRVEENPSINNYWIFHCSFLDCHLLVELVPEIERELFAANMYSHALLVQVFYSYFQREYYKQVEDSYNAFPRVCGILWTCSKHICPAVLPSMLLYWSPDMFNGRYSSPKRKSERELWLTRHNIFDTGIEAINAQMQEKLKLLTGTDDYDVDGIKHRYDFEHAKLKSLIQNGTLGGRVINGFS
jgi:hypothetical protein